MADAKLPNSVKSSPQTENLNDQPAPFAGSNQPLQDQREFDAPRARNYASLSSLRSPPCRPTSRSTRSASDRGIDRGSVGTFLSISSWSTNSAGRHSGRSSAGRISAGAGGNHRVGRCCSAYSCAKRKTARCCRILSKSRLAQSMMLLALLCALFMPDLWVLADMPDNSDLDIVLTVVLLMFLVDLVVQCVSFARTYWASFFFWMDLLGTLSLLLDLSYLAILSSMGGDDISGNVMIMRAARTAKLGARAGRFTRLVKLLRFLPGMREHGAHQGIAKVISGRLVTALSTRVSCLIIVMVIVLPIFSMWSYPEEDWSMDSWLRVLELTLHRHPERLRQQLVRFEEFYADMGYHPYTLWQKAGSTWAPNQTVGLLVWQTARGPPRRLSNLVLHESSLLECYFNFRGPQQIDALMNLFMLLVVMVLMVGFSLVLSNSVCATVLRPLEKLMLQVRDMASSIFQSVTDMAGTMSSEIDNSGDEDKDEDSPGNETELLERVVQKLAVLSEITMSKWIVDDKTLQGLDERDRAVIHGFQGHGRPAAPPWQPEEDGHDDTASEGDCDSLLEAQRAMVENAGLSMELLNSWNLNPLELDRARNHAAATFFVGPQNHGVPFDAMLMAHFLESAELGYSKGCPYHSWFHAVDVTHGVYRLLTLCSTDAFLSGSERFALLVSALSHDIGHPGLNNIFLIETSHELALRYNDKSPLENMHCARLFELSSQPKCNIFAALPRPQFLEVRKVCIDAILHTDNAQHLGMIKDVQMLYEVNSVLMDRGRDVYKSQATGCLSREVIDCFREADSRQLLIKLLLHLADISNSMKPFRICRVWACQVLEEFFLQGDEERRLSMPVQALNDREKVNKHTSQVGFIEFLVSPLLFATVKLLPAVDSLLEQAVQNARSWQQHWLIETKPVPMEQERAALADRVAKLELRLHDCMAA